jgi:hypothetical protein
MRASSICNYARDLEVIGHDLIRHELVSVSIASIE